MCLFMCCGAFIAGERGKRSPKYGIKNIFLNASIPTTFDYIFQGEALAFFPYIGHVNRQLATVVDDDSKTPFSIATTRRCTGRHHSFP